MKRMTSLLLLVVLTLLPGAALAQKPDFKAPTRLYATPELFLLLRLPGDRATIRYTPGYLDRAANLQNRLELSARIFERWADRPIELEAYVLGPEDWEQARLDMTYGIPIRVGHLGIAAPAAGNDSTIRLWAGKLQGILPTVHGLPLRGSPQEAASLVVADIVVQLLVAEALVDEVRVGGDQHWVRGLMTHVVALGLVKSFDEGRLRDLDAMYALLTQEQGAKTFSARDYHPDLTLSDWLWFQAQFHVGAKQLIEKEGRDAIKKMIKMSKKQGTVPGELLLRRYKPLNEWFLTSFAAVSRER